MVKPDAERGAGMPATLPPLDQAPQPPPRTDHDVVQADQYQAKDHGGQATAPTEPIAGQPGPRGIAKPMEELHRTGSPRTWVEHTSDRIDDRIGNRGIDRLLLLLAVEPDHVASPQQFGVGNHVGHVGQDAEPASSCGRIDAVFVHGMRGLIIGRGGDVGRLRRGPLVRIGARDIEGRRFGERRFAAGASREQIQSCAELGLTLEEFVGSALASMQGISGDLGL